MQSQSEESAHPSVVSDLFDGDLGADELNEIPTLPEMDGTVDNFVFDPTIATSLLDHHPATQIALTASALDGALGTFEFLETTETMTNTAVPQETSIPALPVSINTVHMSTGTGNKRSSPNNAGGLTKKRRVEEVHGSPVLSFVVGEHEPPALALISPGSSGEHRTTITPPLSSMPELPPVSGSTQSLLPRPTTETAPATEDPPATTATKKSKSSPTKNKPLVIPPAGAPADTSTEHVHMLISEVGPAECAKAIVAVPTGVDGRRVSKAHLSQEERAQASRDRNREHARNTRLRKKAYVEELKRTLLALCDQRDVNDLEEKRKTKLEDQNRNVRFSVLEEFLNLRASNSQDEFRWSAILVPEFTLRSPAFNAQESVGDMTLAGVAQVMEDCNAFSSFLQSIGSGPSAVSLQYDLDRSNLFMDGNSAILEWNASTVGAVAKGAKEEIKFRGNIKAQFDPLSNKIVSATMLFDSGVVLAQKKSLMLA